MARIDILAPVEVVSFTKDRAKPKRTTDPGFAFVWGRPARFNFGPQADEKAGPEVMPPEGSEDEIGSFRAFWGNGEKVWVGHEVFREASLSVTGEASPSLPIDVEGIRTVTFDLGEREILHEEKRQVGSVTVIYPTIEHCREYLDLELSLTTVLSRGTAPPPDTPPAPVPQEIADAPVIEETYDWSAPDFEGEAQQPAPLNTVPETVDLGAFRTPIRHASGTEILMLACAWMKTGIPSGLLRLHFEDPPLGDFGWGGGSTDEGVTWPWPEDGKGQDYYDQTLKGNFVTTGGAVQGSGLWPIHIYLNLSAILTALDGPRPEVLRVRVTAKSGHDAGFSAGQMHFEMFRNPRLESLWDWDQNVITNQATYPSTMEEVWPRAAPDDWDAFEAGEGRFSVPAIPNVVDYQTYGYLDINLTTKAVTFTPA